MDFCKLVNAEFNSAVPPVKLSRTKGNIQIERSEDSFPDLLWWLKDKGSYVWALADVSVYINEFRDDLTAIYDVSVVPGSGYTVAGAHISSPQRWDSVLVTWGSSPCVMAPYMSNTSQSAVAEKRLYVFLPLLSLPIKGDYEKGNS